MELKKTQMQVLKVLVENKNKFLSKRDIHNLSKVNNNHIDNAVKFFLLNDLIYAPNIEGKIKVTPDGIEVYEENL